MDVPAIPDAKTLATNYELSSALGDRKCAVTLDASPPVPASRSSTTRRHAMPLFGFLNETVAWLPGIAGSIRFVNAAKRTVSEFTEGVGGRYEALREGDGVYFLSNLQFVDPGETPQFADLVGEWNIARPGGPPICTIYAHRSIDRRRYLRREREARLRSVGHPLRADFLGCSTAATSFCFPPRASVFASAASRRAAGPRCPTRRVRCLLARP